MKRDYLVLFLAFATLTLASWPLLFSFDLWVFKDRGSFLNLDYMLANHFRLAVDTYYSYGLLPVFLQHLLFAFFGRGYWPLIGCALVTLCLMAAFWARFLLYLPQQKLWLIAVVAISPILLWVNPNFPYSLVQLSLLFALLCVLENRLDLALAISVVGWFSVPSLPLVLTALLTLSILMKWTTGPERSVARLARQLAPGVFTYAAIAGILTALYGFRSVTFTSIPVLGMKFYKSAHLDPIATSLEFLHPPGHSLLYYVGYYIGTPATWWFASTVALFLFAPIATKKMLHRRTLDPKDLFIVLCAILHAVFVFAARGSLEQYVIYDPLLAAAVLFGIAYLLPTKSRNYALVAFAVVAVLSEVKQARTTVLAWKDTRPLTTTANLYATPAMAADWSHIVDVASQHKLLLLSYGTGAHHYFPNVQTPDLWTLRKGQLFPADRDRLLRKLTDANVAVVDLTGLTSAMDSDPNIQRQLDSMCLSMSTDNFKVWSRPSTLPQGAECLSDPRRKRLESRSQGQ